MPGVIDTMILELVLDPTKWTAGQKSAVESLRKTEEQAVRSAQNIEEQGKRASEFFAQLRNQVIGLYAAFTAGKGIKEFISDITQSDATVGYLSKRLNISVADLSVWQNTMKSLGGSAEDATSTFETFNRQIQQAAITGDVSFLKYWDQLGIKIHDNEGKLKSYDVLLKELNRAFAKQPDKARVFEYGSAMGITPKMMDLLMKAPEEYDAVIAKEMALGHATDASAAAAQARQSAWNNFLNTAADLGRQILTNLAPAIELVLNKLVDLTAWFDKNPDLIEGAFSVITGVVGLLSIAITKSLITDALSPLIGIFKTIAAVGRWALAGEVVAGATSAATAVGGVGAGLAALGTGLAILTGIGAAIAAIGAAAYEIYEHWEGIKSFFGFGSKKTATATAQVPSSSAAPGAARTTSGAAKSDIDTLMGMGWTRDQAIGILANLQRESSGNIHAIGDRGTAYGLAQWHPDRQAAFAKWAGHDIRQSTREEQLAFVNYELREGSRKRAGQALMATSSAQSAAQVVSRLYEAPANADREASTRASIAAAMAAMPNSAFALAGAGARVGSNYDNRSHNINSEQNIGQIVINTQATDAAGIAQDIKPILQRQSWVATADTGPS